jgi:hypothetical protein
MAERAVKIWLELKPKNIEGAKAAFKGMVSDLNKRENEMNKVFAHAASPEYIKQKAGIQFKTNQAQKAMDTAFAQEMSSLSANAQHGEFLGPIVTQFGSLAKLTGPVASFFAAAEKFGGAANPYALERYQLAVNDVNAVIGRVLVPTLNQMETGIRLVGDTLASILPTTEEMDVIVGTLNSGWAEMRKQMEALAPALRELIKVAQLVNPITPLDDGLKKAGVEGGFWGAVSKVGGIVSGLGPLTDAWNTLTGKKPGPLANSTGASDFTPARFTSFSEFGKSNMLAAFNQTRGAGSPAEQTAENTRRAAEALERAEQERTGRDATNRGVDGYSSGTGGDF